MNTDFTAYLDSLGNCAIECRNEEQRCRYHIWIDAATLELHKPATLYKNPLALRRFDPGYFSTRKLSPTAAKNASIVRDLLYHAPELIKAARERAQLAARQQQQEEADRQALGRIRDAAPDLFAALQRALINLELDGPSAAAAILNVDGRAAIAKAQGQTGSAS
jgi:hypothetical protein